MSTSLRGRYWALHPLFSFLCFSVPRPLRFFLPPKVFPTLPYAIALPTCSSCHCTLDQDGYQQKVEERPCYPSPPCCRWAQDSFGTGLPAPLPHDSTTPRILSWFRPVAWPSEQHSATQYVVVSAVKVVIDTILSICRFESSGQKS